MKWRVFVCTDCAPEDDRSMYDFDAGYKLIHAVEDDASRERSCDVEHCPNCGGYLSLMLDEDDVKVTVDRGRYGVAEVQPARGVEELET